ncbi:hypothetical protein V5O48_015386 [Marasmius crinis-equi]|uniref:F-box domain-containing protein n=1 Tax=Marasmius crinis-equi TaxID=585013 RepID=A0ABR3EUN7_9AGAR
MPAAQATYHLSSPPPLPPLSLSRSLVDFHSIPQSSSSFFILNIRTVMTYREGHIPSDAQLEAGLRNITLSGDKRKREELGDKDRPLAVRAKAAKKARKMQKVKRTKRGYLELFFSKAPLDVMYLIFEQLPPRDLVNLSRINKLFHATLTNPSASSIWTSRRIEYGIIASAATDMSRALSDRKWLTLLFGGPYCQKCGSNKGKGLYIRFMKRFCDDCVKARCVTARWLLDNPDPLLSNSERVNDVLDLMIPMLGDPELMDSHYSLLELYGVVGQLIGCKTKEDVLAFATLRRQSNEVQLQYEEACYLSFDEYDKREREEQREIIHKKLLDCGYSTSDFEAIKDQPIVSRAIQDSMTPRAWSRIKGTLFIYIHNHRLNLVLTKPHENEVMHTRLKLLKAYLTSLARGALSFERPEYMPDIYDTLRLRPVALLIAAPDSRLVTKEDFEDMEDELLDHVGRMASKREGEFMWVD